MEKKLKLVTPVKQEPPDVRTRGFMFSIHSIAEVCECSVKTIERRVEDGKLDPEDLMSVARFICGNTGKDEERVVHHMHRRCVAMCGEPPSSGIVTASRWSSVTCPDCLKKRKNDALCDGGPQSAESK